MCCWTGRENRGSEVGLDPSLCSYWCGFQQVVPTPGYLWHWRQAKTLQWRKKPLNFQQLISLLRAYFKSTFLLQFCLQGKGKSQTRSFSRNCLKTADPQKWTSHISKLKSLWYFNSNVFPMTNLVSYFADLNLWHLKATSAEKSPELACVCRLLEKGLPGTACVHSANRPASWQPMS